MTEFTIALSILFIVTLIAFITSIGDWQHQAIIHHAAHYDLQTGKFTWNQEP